MIKKVLYFLLSAAVAFGLWLYVITVVSPGSTDTIRGIQVSLENVAVLEEKGLMVTSTELPTITLELSGNRSDLSKLNPANISVIADLAKVYSTGEQYLQYSIIFPGEVPSNSITVLNQTPKVIQLTIAQRESKEVPVVIDYSGKVPDGFMTDKENLTLDHQTVTISGPAEVVSQITQAKIDVDLENQRETISQSFPYTLCDKAGEPVDAKQVVTDVAEVKLTLKIQAVKEILLELTVVPGGGATAATTDILLSHETIQVAGSEQRLAELGDVLNIGELKLEEILEDSELTYTFKLPEGVTNLTMAQNEVSVYVKFPDLGTKTFRVTNIQARNVPSGLQAQILTDELIVTVRGPVSRLETLTSADLYVTVDFTGAELGTMDSFKAKAYVMNPLGCGAVGTYSVFAKLVEQTAASSLTPESNTGSSRTSF